MKRAKWTFAVLAASGLLLPSVYAADLWTPPWHKEQTARTQMVKRTDKPFIFWVVNTKPFATKAEAESFGKKQVKILMIREHKPKFYLDYLAEMDLSPLVPEKEKEFWEGEMQQYALFMTLRQYYRKGCRIENGTFQYHVQGTFDDERALLSMMGPEGEVLKKEWRAIDEHIKVLDATYRKPIDILSHARECHARIKFAYDYMIPEYIGRLEPGKAFGNSPVRLGKVRVAARQGIMGYRDPGVGPYQANATVVLAATDNGLDHDFLRPFMMARGAKVKRLEDGQVLVTDERGRLCAWKAGKRVYCYVDRDPADIFGAYLKKHPSSLPRDYRIDRAAWLGKEVVLCVERMTGIVEEDRDVGSRYLDEYTYLCRFVDPIKGAPLLPASSVVLDEPTRKYHYDLVKEWWGKHKADFKLRDKAPISLSRVLKEVPHLETKWKPVVEALRQRARKNGYVEEVKKQPSPGT